MKKIFLVLVFSLLAISFIAKPVFAKEAPKQVILSRDQVVTKDYFNAGDSVTINGTINGDAYLAGGNILINGTINGDLIATGGTIIVNGTVAHDIRAAAGQIIINDSKIGGNLSLGAGTITISGNSTISGSMLAAAEQIQVLGTIEKEANLAANRIQITGLINGDADIRVKSLTIAKTSEINGNLNYWSNQKAQIADGAKIKGNVKQVMVPNYEKTFSQASKAFFLSVGFAMKIIDLVASFVIGIMLIYLLPVFSKSVSKTLSKKLWLSLGIGVLTAILTPIAFVIMLITVLGIPLAFIFIFLITLLSYFGMIYISYVIGEKILGGKSQKIAKAWTLLLGLIIFVIVASIPFVGGLFQAFATMMGLGGLLITKRDYLLNLRAKNLI